MNRTARSRNAVHGTYGAAAAGHPRAAAAASAILTRGGNAIDAVIAAQAVICVVMPHAAGVGGDMLALVHDRGTTRALTGTGMSPARQPERYATDGGTSITVPGIVDAWATAARLFGRLPLADSLEEAIRLCDEGIRVEANLATAVEAQRNRLVRHGAADWPLLHLAEGERWRQPELARLLRAVAEHGPTAFYRGAAAEAIANAVERQGGTLDATDLAGHETPIAVPVECGWAGGRLSVQPPPTQGTLLAMVANALDRITTVDHDNLQHVLVELTEAAFAHRDSAARGAALLDETLDVDVDRAQNRGGPRAYLHTAGVAVADSDGMVVSSLVSVFDDFGSGVLVPELGIVLNNRAGGFTTGDNAPGPRRRPVHTLAPALVALPNGDVLALATPGADGQVQTLIQVLARMRFSGDSLDVAIAAPRWRSQDAELLIEDDHDGAENLRRRGHIISPRPAGDDLFGAVVAAGTADGRPFAAADWRRQTTTGAASWRR
ncbi:gamma-glutamyltransferase [Microbacterium alcoholitolerans]|uniref:gamma-glutamyltransferase n=1 Tax=unclassified Microbacterium TaxID=2609290 RepID=UPI003D17ECE2